MENPPHSVNVREAVFDLLRRLVMTTIFGNPGSTELRMFISFPDDFRYVLGLQEAVVVGMADGYAQATGNASLVSLHSAARESAMPWATSSPLSRTTRQW